MQRRILICSHDAVFARMLELELAMHGCSVQVTESVSQELFAEVLLLDLDSASAPPRSCYGRMIGFTRGAAFSEDETRRQCSMILHRPFEMRLLRREVLGDGQEESRDRLAEPHFAQQGETLFLNGVALQLTKTEKALLSCLVAHRGEVVPREMLAGLMEESSANKVDVYVCYLRRKLAKLTPVTLIKTLRNRGYMLQ